MANYLQCPTCGAPSDSEFKCSYCGNIFVNKSTLIISKSNKGQFDLAIYEFRKENFEKSLKNFDELIEKDSANRLAWLLKFASELAIEKDLNQFVDNLNLYNLNDICNSFSNDILKALRKTLIKSDEFDNSYFTIGSINNKVFIFLTNNFSDSFKISLFEIFIERFKSISSDYNKSILFLDELEILTNNFDFSTVEKASINRFINLLNKFSIEILNYFLFAVKFDEEFYNENRKIYGTRKVDNYLFKTYFDSDFTTRIIKIFETLKKYNELTGVNIDKHIEELQTIDSEINKIVENSLTDTGKKKACFIATAAMGDYNHPVVVDLRKFRDECLLKRSWGISFTNWYYKHGPKAASIIEKSTILKRITFYVIIKPLQIITKNLK